MRVKPVQILYNNPVKGGYCLMGLKPDEEILFAPGQFLSLSISDKMHEMPLRRPFTVYRQLDGVIQVMYKVVGRGTLAFSRLKPGDPADLLAPLGNHLFPMEEGLNAVIIGRGVGMASLALLGCELAEKGGTLTTIASFKNRDSDITDEYIRGFSDELVTLYDEDGSSSMDNLSSLLGKICPDIVYTCGSRRIARLLQELPYPAYVSLEERMGCALGSCLTCAVKMKDGEYKRVCKDGPCFNVQEVIV